MPLIHDDPNWTPTTRSLMQELQRIHDRVEDAGIDVPSDVEMLRDWNDSLHRIEEQIKAIRGDTRNIPRLMKSLANIFAFGKSEMDRPDK